MGIRIPDLLEGILEATAAEAAAKARIATLRATLEDEARRRFATEGAAPSWKAPQLGNVRLDPPSAWAPVVADVDAFGSWVAQHYPTEAVAVVSLPAADLEESLEALGYIGVTPLGSRVEVRPAWLSSYLGGLAVDVEEVGPGDDEIAPVRIVTVVDPATGQLVDGLSADRKPAKLVVSLDRDRRTAAVDEARSIAAGIVEAASTDEQAAADLADLDVRRRELEDLHAAQLASIAKAHGLGGSGTKAELAERIARAEVATGNVIRPAATIATDVAPDEAPIGLVATEDVVRSTPSPSWAAESSSPLEDLRAAVKAVEEDGVGFVADDLGAARMLGEHIADELDASYSREVLRGYAKAIGLSAAGSKADVITRLVDEDVTVPQVAAWLERTA